MNDDRQLIRDLVENWVVWRDAGDWERFATVWHEDGVMMATWFQGPAIEFIKVSREGFERGVSILHFLGGTSIDSERRSRAIAQTKMTISQRAEVHGVTVRRRLHRALLRLPREARRPLGDRAAPADLREGPARPARPRRRRYALTPPSSPSSRPATATSPTSRPRSATTVKRDMPGLTGPEVERLYQRGADWLAGATTPGR